MIIMIMIIIIIVNNCLYMRAALQGFSGPEGTKRATSVNVQLLGLRTDLRTGSISPDTVNFPSELCRRSGCVFKEVSRWVPPDSVCVLHCNAFSGRSHCLVGKTMQQMLQKPVPEKCI